MKCLYSCLLLLLFIITALTVCAEESQSFTITDRVIREMFLEVRPQVEKMTGHSFKKEPKIVISTQEHVASVLTTEFLPQMQMQFPDVNQAQQHEKAAALAAQYSAVMLGKYSWSEDCIFVLAGNFSKLAETYNRPTINSPGYLRVVLIHELVHVLDQEVHQAMTRLQGIKTYDDLVIWNAVIEGHAQFVTRRILRDQKKESLFQDFEEQMTALPPGLSEGEKYVAEVQSSFNRFGYIDGRLFFEGLARTGRKTYSDDVFKSPPVRKEVILHPETYYIPRAEVAAVKDLKPLWDSLGQFGEGWSRLVRNMGEMELRAAFGPYVDGKLLDALAPHLLSGQALLLTPKDAPNSSTIVFLILQMDNPESAARIYDMSVTFLKTKDEKMKEGQIRIARSEYASIKTKASLRNTVSTKTVLAGAHEIPTRTLLGEIGSYMVEVDYINQKVDDKELAGSLEAIYAFLRQ